MKKLILIFAFLVASIATFAQAKPTYTKTPQVFKPGNYLFIGNYDTTLNCYKDSLLIIMEADCPQIWGKSQISFYSPVRYFSEMRADAGIYKNSVKVFSIDSINTFNGWYSGDSNTGDFNNGYGYNSLLGNLGNSNNAFGLNAGSYNTGDEGAFYGNHSGESNTGDHCTFYGNYSGYNNTGNAVIGIGPYVGQNGGTDSTLLIGIGNLPLIVGNLKSASKKSTIQGGLNVSAIPAYADSTAARTAGVTNGGVYRIGGTLKIMY